MCAILGHASGTAVHACPLQAQAGVCAGEGVGSGCAWSITAGGVPFLPPSIPDTSCGTLRTEGSQASRMDMAPGYANRGTVVKLRAWGEPGLSCPQPEWKVPEQLEGGSESMAWWPQSEAQERTKGIQWGRESLLAGGCRVSCRPGAPLEGQTACRSQRLLREAGCGDWMISKATCWRSLSAAYPALVGATGMTPASSSPEA